MHFIPVSKAQSFSYRYILVDNPGRRTFQFWMLLSIRDFPHSERART